MKLHEWMRLHKVNGSGMGKMLGLKSSASVYRYVHGQRIPGPRIIRLIAEVTKGEVAANDFIHGEEER